MIFRISQKLQKKLKEDPLSEKPLDENPYADWSCHLFTADRTQYIILTNTPSLYSCLMFGKGITNGKQFTERALGTIREFMEDDGQALVYDRFIIPNKGSVTFAKALNRSVIGSMNDLVQASKFHLADGMASHEVGRHLNDLLLSAIAKEGDRGYSTPRESFKRLTNQGEEQK